jgi:2',3'-cyclic-nucleotide 2'-phosphodiesterase (5'-nucleotidase family)
MERRYRFFSLSACLAVAAITLALPAGAAAKHPETLVVLSTCDLYGTVSPCGCHVPKGGLARRGFFADSIRGDYANVLMVDCGGFVADPTAYLNGTPVLLDGMKKLGVDAVTIGDRDLAFGVSYLRSELKRTDMRVVCANLVDKTTGASAFPPYLIKKVGTATVGVFGLITDRGDLGPGRDSLSVKDPAEAAKATIAEMRAKGVTVVMLLSQLGKVPTDDLTESVEGIDVAIAGRKVPLMQKGRVMGNTVTVYGGEQGHYVGRTLLTLDAQGKATARDAEVVMMGPDVRDRADLAKLASNFESQYQAEAKKHDKTSTSVPVNAVDGTKQ